MENNKFRSAFKSRFFISIVGAPITIYATFHEHLFSLLVILLSIFLFYEWLSRIKSVFDKIFGSLIIIFFIFSIITINNSNNYLTIWLFLIVWISDISGYFVGKYFGKIKIFKISPNKTLEGYLASVLFSQCSYFIMKCFNDLNIIINKVIIVQFLICIACIIGDLFYSFYKRKYKLKDYSNHLGDHGGFLDRVDGLIFSSVIFYIINL
ncbi:MAG: phosphatidate cytidylyltransferase [Candidatus Pelagibacter sp.]|nr:phosphatidate cytidylyltransferase [Candidatus Pelagibacter sp.]OUV97548.1 MAG: hypothetical protein CBD02_02995 [Candidatus Pelagibacter sp. TMED142]